MYLDDPVHLQRVAIDGRSLIGKKVENGIASDRIEDTARSVVSLLTRIDSEWSLLPKQALIVPLSGAASAVLLGAASAVVAPAPDGDSADENFEYAALIPSK